MSAAWTPQWQFDFDVRADQAVVSAVPGQVIRVGIAVDLVRGNPQQVVLVSATNWSSVGLTAQIIPTAALPPSAATLYITVSPNTPPGSYMFAVRGDTQGTFASKEAMVTVTVTNAPAPAPGPAPAPAPIPAPAPVTPAAPSGRARRGRPVYPQKAASQKAAPQGKGPKGAKLVAALVIIAALAIAGYASGLFKDLGNLGGSPSTTNPSGATTYYGTLVSCIGSECASGSTPYVQVDSSGNVLGPVLYGKITKGVFTGYTVDAAGNHNYDMAGTLSSDGTFIVHLSPQSTSHSWTWTMYRQ